MRKSSPFLFFVFGVMFGFFMPHPTPAHAQVETIQDYNMCLDVSTAKAIVHAYEDSTEAASLLWELAVDNGTCAAMKGILIPKGEIDSVTNADNGNTVHLIEMKPDSRDIVFYWIKETE